ncbi:MAG: 16S rRNA (guanine(527)-N(7))-methyltransferase RsmG [Nitrospirota bacterium]
MDIKVLLQSGSEELGTPLSPAQTTLFFIYLSELKRWNRRVNLTSIREDKEIIVKHFLDSLSCLKGFIPQEGSKVIDIGTGAGFPGIPIRIYAPFLDLTLLDSSEKKTTFLHYLCGKLGITDINIINDRLEGLVKKRAYIGGFDIILIRALGNITDILEQGMLLLNHEGIVLLCKGKNIDNDLKLLQKRYKVRVINFILPFSDYERNLIIVKKHI